MKRAHNFNDLAGRKFGRLQAISALVVDGKTRWLCKCECGEMTTKIYQHLVNGLTRSCGCLRKEASANSLRERKTTHGLSVGSTKRAYSIWSGMMYRCYNPEFHRFSRYGGRGIVVCQRWHDPANFAADMGLPADGMTLERINNDKGYSPDNCKWADCKEQNNNRHTTLRITFDGVTLSAAEWARRVGVSKATMLWRLKHWPLEAAVTLGPKR